MAERRDQSRGTDVTAAAGAGAVWPLDLLDWKRRVGAMYASARTGGAGEATLDAFRRDKDRLFATHAQSPIAAEDRARFGGLAYYPARPDLRLHAALEPDSTGGELVLPSSTDEPFRFAFVGRVRPVIGEHEISLAVFWLTSYGGGIFVPFRDTTAGTATYGAGRYLLDTVKGADLGATPNGEMVLDFNYAYNPSCSYDPQWSCPLAPPESRIAIPIEAGERVWPGPAAPGRPPDANPNHPRRS
jgi:uncharacterized protein (DUF1684 family)